MSDNQQTVSEVEKLGEKEIQALIDELDKAEVEDTDKYALKELLRSDKDSIHFKTDLFMHQIESIVKLRTANNIIKAQSLMSENPDGAKDKINNIVVDMTDLFMKLVVSKDRLGRREFIDAYKGGNEKRKKGLWNRWFGKGEEY